MVVGNIHYNVSPLVFVPLDAIHDMRDTIVGIERRTIFEALSFRGIDLEVTPVNETA